MMAETAERNVPRVTPQSTPQEVASAAAEALEHPLSTTLNEQELAALQNAVDNPRLRNSMAHAVIIKLGRLQRQAEEAGFLQRAAEANARRQQTTRRRQSVERLAFERELADSILGNKPTCWALEVLGLEHLLDQLANPNPRQVSAAVQTYQEYDQQLHELLQLWCNLHETAEQLVLESFATCDASEFTPLWRDIESITWWLCFRRAEMTESLAERADVLIEAFDQHYYEPDQLRRLIRDGDRLLGRIVTGKWAGK